MTSSDTNLHAAAEALRMARNQCKSIAPISASFGISTLEAAYAVSAINIQAELTAGRRVVGLKVGLTSKAVQQQLGIEQPDFGVLLDNMEYLNLQDVPMARLIQPKVEAEVAFVVGRDLPGIVPSYAEFVAALDYALPAIEIVDSAISDWKISLADTVADNASSALYVLGDQPVLIGTASLGEFGMSLTKNGITVSVGTGAACLGHPLRAAYWLAKTMSAKGHGLKAGQVILSGALGPMVSVGSGDVIHAQIGTLGNVSCRFV